MSSIADLVVFLTARLTEDEKRANLKACPLPDPAAETEDEESLISLTLYRGGWNSALGVIGYDAERALREVEAARQALDHYERIRVHARDKAAVDYELALGAVEKQLMYRALVYSDHPDYQEAWKP